MNKTQNSCTGSIFPGLITAVIVTVTGLIILFPGHVFCQSNMKSIAVIPFFKGQKPEADSTVMETEISRFHIAPGNLASGGEESLTRILHRSLVKKYGARVMPIDTVTPSLESLMKQSGGSITPLNLAVNLGKTLKADYIVLGNVWRFKERSGNAIASEQPSSVAFKVHIISVSGNTRIWEGKADKTQQPLADNLLKVKDFFEQGAHWLTAEELAKREMDTMLKRLPVIHDDY